MDVSTRGDEALASILQQFKQDEEARRALAIRKRCELKLVRKFDKVKIDPSRECWFMVDAAWLNKWSEFVNDPDADEPPGPLSTKDLLTAPSSSSGNREPLPGLTARIDYRAVPPMVYFILIELYGRDSSPDICRYAVDVYKPEVPVDAAVSIKLKAVMEAKIQVNKIRPKWMDWKVKFEDEEEEQSSCCCGLTQEHLEAFIFWAIRCWSTRKQSGRSEIKYSAYKPLTNTNEMDESVRLQASQHSEGGSWWSLSSWSAHGNPLTDSSTHSTRSSGSSHGGLGEFAANRQQSNRGPRMTRGPRSRMEEDEIEEENDSNSDSDSDSDVELAMAPADRGYERGMWLRSSFSASNH